MEIGDYIENIYMYEVLFLYFELWKEGRSFEVKLYGNFVIVWVEDDDYGMI